MTRPFLSSFSFLFFAFYIPGQRPLYVVEGNGGSYQANWRTNLVITHHELSLLFEHFINTTANHFD